MNQPICPCRISEGRVYTHHIPSCEFVYAASAAPPSEREVWRVGSTVPINIYEGDRPICQCHTVADAKRIVEAVNAARAAVPQAAAREESDFLNASIAVWREIDRLMTMGPYPGIPMAADLRLSEKLAWERYRAVLDSRECDECGHAIKSHGEHGCEVERGDGYRNGSEYAEALGPCGCKGASA